MPRSDAAQKKPPKLKTFVCSQTGMRVAYEGAGSVIFDRKLAQRFYTPARMYAENKRREEKSSSAPMTVDGPRRRTRTKKGKQKRNSTAAAGRLAELMAEFDALPPDAPARDLAELKARNHDARQPEILGAIVDVLTQDPTRSYSEVSADIGYWCSGDTIGRFFASMKSHVKLERVLPLLNQKQRRASVQFSKHARSNWNRGAGKYLWIHLDEKWMYGMLLRHAKVCEALGLRRVHQYAQHKNHISKIMIMALVGFAFVDSPENGGTGMRLGFHRVQAAKVAQREVNERDPATGKRPRVAQGGKNIRMADDLYMVPCEVVADSRGTSANPKFSLMSFLRDIFFPQIEIIVGVGGEWEGYTPIIQWDGAGPHTQKALVRFATEFCAEKGWAWEPQSSQNPYFNVLDLLVFPALSRRHSHLLRSYSSKAPAPPDRIYGAAVSAWNALSCVDIAKGFVLAHRLQKKVITAKGGNNFLNDGGLHCGVSKDFEMDANRTGLRRVDGQHQPAPAVRTVAHRVYPPAGFFKNAAKPGPLLR